MKDTFLLLMLLLVCTPALAQGNDNTFDYIRPAWAPNGKAFAYLSNETGTYQLFKADLEMTTAKRITSVPDGVSQFKWSPLSDKIAYVSGQALDIIDVNTEEILHVSTQEVTPLFFEWAPSGKELTYSCEGMNGSVDICVKLVSDGEQRHLVEHEATERNFSWSPDGRYLAFGSDRDGKFDLFLLDTTTRMIDKIADLPNHTLDPLFSPDGKHIAFISDRTGENRHFDVYVSNRDGANHRQITARNGYNLPLWFPDGEHLLIVSNANKKWEVFTANLNHDPLKKLTNGLAFSVSPDAATVLVQRQRDRGNAIYLIEIKNLASKELTAWLAN